MTWLRGVAAITVALLFATNDTSHHTIPGAGSQPAPHPNPSAETVAARRGRELVERGVEFLAAHQNSDGSFGGKESRHVRVGVSALATLALMAHGDLENRGRFQDKVARGIRFLMSCSVNEGPLAGYLTCPGDDASQMHGHGYATLALTQAHGMFGTRRKHANSSADLKRVIRGAIDVIIRSQSMAGGWYYRPLDRSEDEGSLTVCMIQALRGARNAGFAVPRECIDRALRYLHRCQNSDGSFRYRLHGDQRPTFELTAAACSSLIHAGAYFDRSVEAAREWLFGEQFDAFISEAPRGYPYYGMLHAVQVLHFDYHRKRMRNYYPRIVEWFESRFDPASGLYREPRGAGHRESTLGPTYRAAMATLTLQVRDGYLPLFDR